MSESTLSERLLSLDELAKFVGRHPQLLRRYYAKGKLPDPVHTVKHTRKVTRKFTLQEAERIKILFDNVKWGTFSHKGKK